MTPSWRVVLRGLAAGVALVLGACSREPAFVHQEAEVELVLGMQDALGRAAELDTRAVHSPSAEESAAIAEQGQRLVRAIERDRREVSRLLADDGRPAERARLLAFDVAWAEVQPAEARWLERAVRSGPGEAAAPSPGACAATVDRFAEDQRAVMAAQDALAALLRELRNLPHPTR